LKIKRVPNNIADFVIDDFEIIDYEPQGIIRAEVAV
jgi:thymidylate synthase